MIDKSTIKFAFVTVLAIAINTSDEKNSMASNPKSKLPSLQEIAALPPVPSRGTPNGQRTPGGTRTPDGKIDGKIGACKPTDKLLTALVPEDAKGLTTVEHPVFWFYIPYAPKEVHSVEFSLHDQQETTTIYRIPLQLTKTPGIYSISLPPNSEKALKLNEPYHWYFKLNCDPQEKLENDIVLDGWVTRVQPNTSQIIWYDKLTDLSKRLFSNPKNSQVKKDWEEFLKSVGLEGLAQVPVVN
ncbi:hypothetical protein WA1_48130 [Scytonema hofmannii PCC 7110]|uniref:DUF928 domain-containing protein n=1 Tax=Scytonema hofmannii PCC 7110 TaxID=128403 RepID=A0A139WY61_9CYAN|nr:DUF928 domain-containing protein [Scytonema hofmannii]KYC37381.1 hypothetical protein WA1_48130 [Scytonema hofmannii PCC 7110]